MVLRDGLVLTSQALSASFDGARSGQGGRAGRGNSAVAGRSMLRGWYDGDGVVFVVVVSAGPAGWGERRYRDGWKGRLGRQRAEEEEG